MARSRADAANTYDQLLHPFDGWTFGAYAHEAGQFGIGEAKGAVNMVAGAIVDTSPALMLADGMTGSRLSHPIVSVGESQEDGEATFPWVVAAATGVEALAAAPEAAEAAAGTRSLNCFAAGTPVQMADGTTKPIERVREGDLVKSRNPATGVTEAKQVTETFSHVAPQVLTLTLSDPKTGLPVEHLVCTPEHPFYVDGRGFVKAGDLGIGTSIVTRAGPVLTLSAALWSALPAPATGLALGGGNPGGYHVYNLRVEDDHSYFVGTVHGGTCVHNADETYGFDTALYARAKEIDAKSGYFKTTTAVATAAKDGDVVKLVASSRKSLTDEQIGLLKPGEIAVTGIGHAERTIVAYALRNGYQIVDVAASSGICSKCLRSIYKYGGRPASPLKRAPGFSLRDLTKMLTPRY